MTTTTATGAPRRVRVGVVGCGMIAQLMHLPSLTELPDLFDVVAVCDRVPGLAKRTAVRCGAPRAHDSVEAMLAATPEIDAVMILTSDHYAPALTALKYGKHVFTEKPLGHTLTETRHLVETAERVGVTLMVGFMKRYDSGVRAGIKEIQAAGVPVMARLHIVVGPHYGNWIVPELRDIDTPSTDLGTDDRIPRVVDEFGDSRPIALNSYMDMLGVWSHDINLYRALFPATPDSIKAHASPDGTTLTALLRYANGMQCVFQGATTSVRRFEESLTVWGKDRTVTLDIANPFLRHVPSAVTVWSNDPSAAERTVRGSHHEPFREQLVHFHACVTTGCAPLTSGRESIDDLRLMVDIVRAAWSEQP